MQQGFLTKNLKTLLGKEWLLSILATKSMDKILIVILNAAIENQNCNNINNHNNLSRKSNAKIHLILSKKTYKKFRTREKIPVKWLKLELKSLKKEDLSTLCKKSAPLILNMSLKKGKKLMKD